MEKEDLKQIREVFQEEFKESFNGAFGSIWEDNLEPAFDSIHKKIAALLDKAYLDNKLAELEGTLDY